MDRIFKFTRQKGKTSTVFTFGIEDNKKTVKNLVKTFNGTLYERQKTSSNQNVNPRPKTNEMYNNLCLSKNTVECI